MDILLRRSWSFVILHPSHEWCCTEQSDMYTTLHLILTAHSESAAFIGPAINKVNPSVTSLPPHPQHALELARVVGLMLVMAGAVL